MKTRIIVFNLNWLGDILFSIPNLRTLKHHYQQSRITCIIPTAYRDLLKGQSFIDEIIACDDRSISGKIKLLLHLRARKWDIGFLFHRSKTRARIFKWGGIHERIGYDTNHRRKLLTVAISEPGDPLHKMDYLTNLIKKFGIKPICDDYSFSPPPVVLQKMSLPKPYVVFHPGSNWKPKMWPPDHYAKLGDWLSKKYKTHIVITGTAHEQTIADEILRAYATSGFSPQNDPFSLCGKTSLPELADVLKNASLVIAGDTGPMHLASAVGTPLLALYGPTSPKLNGPRGKGATKIIWKNPGCKTYPCFDKSCLHDRCLNDLSPEEVFQSLEEWGILDES